MCQIWIVPIRSKIPNNVELSGELQNAMQITCSHRKPRFLQWWSNDFNLKLVKFSLLKLYVFEWINIVQMEGNVSNFKRSY